jgi:hypothetical protein
MGTYSTLTTSSSTTFIDTGLSASITLSSTSSKVLVLVAQSCFGGSYLENGAVSLNRNSTELFQWQDVAYPGSIVSAFTANYLDSPATTSSVTYKTRQRLMTSGNFYTQVDNNIAQIILMEIAA